MNQFGKAVGRVMSLSGLLLALFLGTSPAQERTGALRGQITDELGGLIVGATVVVTDASGAQRKATTGAQGVYAFEDLAPGRYGVSAQASGFAAYENDEVDISAGRRESLDIRLGVSLEKQEVTVTSETSLNAEPENNANAIILREQDLNVLPDDPEELAAALQALAGPSAGPNGGQIYIDGFTGGRLPPKDAIREVRINQNPFTAENDRPGFGRVDIITKPGTDKFRGSAFTSFMDESLNSRNPFAPNRPSFQRREFGGNLSGTLIPRRASFFFDLQRQDQGENELINATVLDDALLTPRPFRLAVLTPREFTTFSPRFDYQLNRNHTLAARYSFSHQSGDNAGVGGFNLPSRGFGTSNTQHTLQVTETAVLGPSVVNELRFQYIHGRRAQEGDNSEPAVNVLEAFYGGGSQVGLSLNDEDRWELQNYVTRAFNGHTVKFGGRLRGVRVTDVSENNFGGTFTFAGGVAPVLDADNQVVPGRFELITSIERFRRTQLFRRQGLTPDEIRARGGGAAQFSASAGDPEAGVSQTDFGGFIQDDWRVRQNLVIGMGLRYETQSNISSHWNLAPRLAFAWSVGGGGARPPKAVVRGGGGIFYERFGESLTLQANRFDGTNQRQFIVREPAFLTVPPTETLEGGATRRGQIIRRVAENFQSPYAMLAAIQFERQLPAKFTMTVLAYTLRVRHVPRQRNVNAPVPGTFVPGDSRSGVRPYGEIGEIFLYESSGVFNEERLQVSLNNRLSPALSMFANYTFGRARSNADGFFNQNNVGGFPADQYDLSGEYGRAAFDVRHRFVAGGTIGIPKLKLLVNPLVIARTGFPFNITTGRDTNGDTLFTERPALATDFERASVVRTRFGDFDLNPLPGQETIPRNYGRGPSFFVVNIGVGRMFSFGDVPGAARAAGSNQGGPAALISGGGTSEKRYTLVFSVHFENVFNRTNPALPVGNLSSSLFGESVSSAGPFGFGSFAGGNRRVRAQIRFSF